MATDPRDRIPCTPSPEPVPPVQLDLPAKEEPEEKLSPLNEAARTIERLFPETSDGYVAPPKSVRCKRSRR